MMVPAEKVRVFEWGQQCSLPQANSDQLYLNVTPLPPSLSGADSVCNATRCFISAFSLHTAVFFSLQPLCLVHTEKPTGRGSLPLQNQVSDSANPHYVSDPLPQPLCDHRSTGQL